MSLCSFIPFVPLFPLFRSSLFFFCYPVLDTMEMLLPVEYLNCLYTFITPEYCHVSRGHVIDKGIDSRGIYRAYADLFLDDKEYNVGRLYCTLNTESELRISFACKNKSSRSVLTRFFGRLLPTTTNVYLRKKRITKDDYWYVSMDYLIDAPVDWMILEDLVFQENLKHSLIVKKSSKTNYLPWKEY